MGQDISKINNAEEGSEGLELLGPITYKAYEIDRDGKRLADHFSSDDNKTGRNAPGIDEKTMDMMINDIPNPSTRALVRSLLTNSGSINMDDHHTQATLVSQLSSMAQALTASVPGISQAYSVSLISNLVALHNDIDPVQRQDLIEDIRDVLDPNRGESPGPPSDTGKGHDSKDTGFGFDDPVDEEPDEDEDDPDSDPGDELPGQEEPFLPPDIDDMDTDAVGRWTELITNMLAAGLISITFGEGGKPIISYASRNRGPIVPPGESTGTPPPQAPPPQAAPQRGIRQHIRQLAVSKDYPRVHIQGLHPQGLHPQVKFLHPMIPGGIPVIWRQILVLIHQIPNPPPAKRADLFPGL